YERHAVFIKKIVILLWNHTTCYNHDGFSSEFFQRGNSLWYQRFVTGSKTGYTKYMHIVFHCLLCRFSGRLKQRTNIHIKAKIGETAGNYPCTAVVSVLSNFCDHAPWPASVLFSQLIGEFTRSLTFLIHFYFFAVHT